MAEVTSTHMEFFTTFTVPSVADLEAKTKFSLKSSLVSPRIISMEEVSWHAEPNDCWIIIFDRVYDVTNFLHEVSNSLFKNSWDFNRKAQK